MTPEEFQRVDEVFRRAVTLAPPDRANYLDDTCNAEPWIRARVESLLARDETPHAILDVEPPEATPVPAERRAPDRIGPYRILDVLGSGAMGIVYRAEQDKPRRLVALKLMRSGFSGAQALRRFHQEADLLGRLQHPGVANVIEAGTTAVDDGDDAQPYFVMELVDGRPLLEHIRHHDLGVRARIELLVRICDAVEHAHLSGIVHRDLKPANILVKDPDTGSSHASRDGSPAGQPKILDFGVARIMDGDRAALTLRTSAGELVGTLPYMSPEQIAGDLDAVDTRCDVYALGVLLFEMLTGRRPHDVTGRSLAEAARIICEDAPTPLRTIDRHLRGDLDTICATATAKDVERRYPSVAALAGDLRRYLADEPILARPPTTLYQLGKFARRNRGLVGGIVAAMLVLVAGLVTSAILYGRAETRAEAMRHALYGQRISLAQNALASGDAREVYALLEACPSDLRHWEWRRLRLLADRSEQTLRGHTGIVNDVAFTPNGRFVVTAGGYDEATPPEDRERSARVWDARDGTPGRVFGGHELPVAAVALSPDGQSLVTLTGLRPQAGLAARGWLRRWNLEDGRLLAEHEAHPRFGGGLCFTSGGDGLFVGGGFGRVARLDLERGDVVWRVEGTEKATGIAVTSDGASVVAADWAGVVGVWDTRTGEERWRRTPHARMGVWAMAVSPDGRTIATASKDRTVRLLDLASGAEQRVLPDAGAAVTAVAFAPDGRVLSGAEDGVIRVYDPATGGVERVLLGHAGAVTRLAFAPDALRLASASRDGTAKLWRLDAPPLDRVLNPHGANEVNRVAWAPDGSRIVTAGDDGYAHVLDARRGTPLIALPHEWQFVHAADWSADGSRIATMDGRGELTLWDAATGARLVTWSGHDRVAWRASFSPDGALLASTARGQVRLWDGRTGAFVRGFDGGSADVLAVAWRPDGAVLATGDVSGVVTLRDPREGTTLAVWPTLGVPVEALCFHPDGERLAVGDRSGVLSLYDARRPRRVLTVAAHAGACESIAFSPDGARLLTGGRDGWLRLFEADTGDHVMTLKEHRSGTVSAVFSPDGIRIASTSRDFTVRIWNAGASE